MLTAITGINWGDEGKGRMVDLLSQEYNIVVRYQGGNNAGHTVVTPEGKFVLNLLPSGILRPDVVCVMGNGMVIDPAHLEKEIATLRQQGIVIDPSHLKISDRATICMPYHVQEDGLEEDRLALFPDAPTERGVKHLRGLIRAREEGFETYVLFLIQMKGIRAFSPNDRTHPAFGEALRDADKAGVHILALDCLVTPEGMTAGEPIPVRL